MGIGPPFVYERAPGSQLTAERGFNPRAATQAAWATEKRASTLSRASTATGPLIPTHEFNKHPDSYFIV